MGFSDMEIRGNAGQFGQGKSNGCSGNRKWKSLEGLGETGSGNSCQKSYLGTGLSFGLVPKTFFRNSRYFSGQSYTKSGIIYL